MPTKNFDPFDALEAQKPEKQKETDASSTIDTSVDPTKVIYTEDEYNQRIQEAAEKIKLNLSVVYMHRGKKQLYASSTAKNLKKIKTRSAVKNFVDKSYVFLFNPKKHMLLYNNGFKRREMRVYNDTWGNALSAMNDLANYSWAIKNKEALRVMNQDPINYFEMQAILIAILQYTAQMRKKMHKHPKKHIKHAKG